MECEFRCDQLQRRARHDDGWSVHNRFVTHCDQLLGFERDEWHNLLLRCLGDQFCGDQRQLQPGIGDALSPSNAGERDD